MPARAHALGLLLAVPLLACVIGLVRELYSYDVLALGLDIDLTPDRTRARVLTETAARPDDVPALDASLTDDSPPLP